MFQHLLSEHNKISHSKQKKKLSNCSESIGRQEDLNGRSGVCDEKQKKGRRHKEDFLYVMLDVLYQCGEQRSCRMHTNNRGGA